MESQTPITDALTAQLFDLCDKLGTDKLAAFEITGQVHKLETDLAYEKELRARTITEYGGACTEVLQLRADRAALIAFLAAVEYALESDVTPRGALTIIDRHAVEARATLAKVRP